MDGILLEEGHKPTWKCSLLPRQGAESSFRKTPESRNLGILWIELGLVLLNFSVMRQFNPQGLNLMHCPAENDTWGGSVGKRPELELFALEVR